jgi:branched-subunit amino acid transport protein
VSWWVLIALAAGAYGFKALGLIVLGGRELPMPLTRVVALLPAALLAALIAVQTFTGPGRSLVIDARAAGVGAACVVAWRKGPFVAVILVAAAVTALVRAVS